MALECILDPIEGTPLGAIFMINFLLNTVIFISCAAPRFVSMHSIGDFLYVFFTEEGLTIESQERVSPFHLYINYLCACKLV